MFDKSIREILLYFFLDSCYTVYYYRNIVIIKIEFVKFISKKEGE